MALKNESAASPKVKKPSRPKGSHEEAALEGAAVSGVAMLMVPGDPSAALKDLALPRGARVAIVSSDPEVMKKVRRRAGWIGHPEGDSEVGQRGGQIRRERAMRSEEGPFGNFGQSGWFGHPGHSEHARPPKKLGEAAAIDRDAFQPDARAQALLEGVRIAQDDLRQAGGAYDLGQVRTLMRGITRQAIDKRVREGRLLALPGPSNRRAYPTLQFNPDGTAVEGLKEVREALPTANPWTVLNFLARPDDRLDGRKPIDLLKAGKVGLVVEAARRLALQGG